MKKHAVRKVLVYSACFFSISAETLGFWAACVIEVRSEEPSTDSFCNWVLTGHRPFETRQSLPDSSQPQNSPIPAESPEWLVLYGGVELRTSGTLRSENVSQTSIIECVCVCALIQQMSFVPYSVLDLYETLAEY